MPGCRCLRGLGTQWWVSAYAPPAPRTEHPLAPGCQHGRGDGTVEAALSAHPNLSATPCGRVSEAPAGANCPLGATHPHPYARTQATPPINPPPPPPPPPTHRTPPDRTGPPRTPLRVPAAPRGARFSAGGGRWVANSAPKRPQTGPGGPGIGAGGVRRPCLEAEPTQEPTQAPKRLQMARFRTGKGAKRGQNRVFSK